MTQPDNISLTRRLANSGVSVARWIARKFLPPIVRELLPRKYIWSGIYSRLEDVPEKIGSHDSYVAYSLRSTAELLESARRSGTIPLETAGEYALLGLLAAAISPEDRDLKILDFGGGLGADFIHLDRSLSGRKGLEYHVVEIERAVEEGTKLFSTDPRIRFHSRIPSIENVDIVLLKGALQYVEDPGVLIREICALEPRYVFFVNLSAGDFPTYATQQRNIPGALMAYRFINAGEVIDHLSAAGFRLVYRSALEKTYDQSNFPPEYRMGRTCNLLFERSSTASDQ